MPPAIAISHLSHTFASPRGPVTALRDFNLEIAPGEFFGLFGPNGAGKTTLIRILTTLILPTQGSAAIYGHDVVREAGLARAHLGLVFSNENSFYGRLTGQQNLEFFAALQNLTRAEARDAHRGAARAVRSDRRRPHALSVLLHRHAPEAQRGARTAARPAGALFGRANQGHGRADGRDPAPPAARGAGRPAAQDRAADHPRPARDGSAVRARRHPRRGAVARGRRPGRADPASQRQRGLSPGAGRRPVPRSRAEWGRQWPGGRPGPPARASTRWTLVTRSTAGLVLDLVLDEPSAGGAPNPEALLFQSVLAHGARVRRFGPKDDGLVTVLKQSLAERSGE